MWTDGTMLKRGHVTYTPAAWVSSDHGLLVVHVTTGQHTIGRAELMGALEVLQVFRVPILLCVDSEFVVGVWHD